MTRREKKPTTANTKMWTHSQYPVQWMNSVWPDELFYYTPATEYVKILCIHFSSQTQFDNQIINVLFIEYSKLRQCLEVYK